MANKTNHKDGVLVKGTSGNDYILNDGGGVTIAAGGGKKIFGAKVFRDALP